MSLQDSLFSDDVEYDVNLFSKDKRRKRVLVFPPVNNYRRFLIHQLVQDRFTDLLHTFSIGQGFERRTVVCYKSDLIRDPKSNGADHTPDFTKKKTLLDTFGTMGVEEEGRTSLESPENIRLQRQVKSIPAREIYRPPAARKVNLNQQRQVSSESLITQTMNHNDACSIKNNKQKRPDRAVYVPRHRRSLETEANSLPVTADRITRDQLLSSNARKQKDSCPAQQSTDNERKNIETVHKLKKFYDKSSVSNSMEDSNRISSSSLELTDSKVSKQDSVVPKLEEISRLDVIDMKTKDMSMSEKQSTSETSSEFYLEEEESNKSLCKSLILINMEMTSSTDLQSNNKSKGLSDNHSIEKSEPCDIVMSPVTTEEQKSKGEYNANDDKTVVNNKNKRAVRQNLVSDVLIISDNPEKQKKVVKEVTVVPVTPPEKKVKKVERPKSKPARPPSPPVKINRDECEWDSLFNDDGDCLDPTLIEELTSAVGEVIIEQPKTDYKTYSKQIEVSSDEFAHVLEIYNFPSEFKTSDLAAVFSPFKSNGFELKWVDDTHCLGVFSSPLIAAEVLASDHPFVKTRPLSEATALSRTKARRSAEFLQPYRTRPETCAALARRLVTGALGVKLATARQEREREKNILREAKEKKRLANKQREDAWEGIIPEK